MSQQQPQQQPQQSYNDIPSATTQLFMPVATQGGNACAPQVPASAQALLTTTTTGQGPQMMIPPQLQQQLHALAAAAASSPPLTAGGQAPLILPTSTANSAQTTIADTSMFAPNLSIAAPNLSIGAVPAPLLLQQPPQQQAPQPQAPPPTDIMAAAAMIQQQQQVGGYRDFSRFVGATFDASSSSSVATTTSAKDASSFPMKLHTILSDPAHAEFIAWLPHGRSWRVVKPKAFEVKVIPKFFRHAKYASFMRQVNGWGFTRITAGPDHNSYYHELFLRGLPNLCANMRRPVSRSKANTHSILGLMTSATGTSSSTAQQQPDFYAMSLYAPLPNGHQQPPPATVLPASSSVVGGSLTAPNTANMPFNSTIMTNNNNNLSFANSGGGRPGTLLSKNTDVATTPTQMCPITNNVHGTVVSDSDRNASSSEASDRNSGYASKADDSSSFAADDRFVILSATATTAAAANNSGRGREDSNYGSDRNSGYNEDISGLSGEDPSDVCVSDSDRNSCYDSTTTVTNVTNHENSFGTTKHHPRGQMLDRDEFKSNARESDSSDRESVRGLNFLSTSLQSDSCGQSGGMPLATTTTTTEDGIASSSNELMTANSPFPPLMANGPLAAPGMMQMTQHAAAASQQPLANVALPLTTENLATASQQLSAAAAAVANAFAAAPSAQAANVTNAVGTPHPAPLTATNLGYLSLQNQLLQSQAMIAQLLASHHQQQQQQQQMGLPPMAAATGQYLPAGPSQTTPGIQQQEQKQSPPSNLGQGG